MNCPLHTLTDGSLRALAASLRSGILASGMSRSEVQRICGNAPATDYLEKLYQDGFLAAHIHAIVQAVLDTRESAEPLSHILDVIVSGPDVPGVPVGDTFAALHGLIQGAAEEVIVAGYAIYNGKIIFKTLAERMDENPNLRATFLVHIDRKGRDTTIESDLVGTYAHRFVTENWPGKRLPEMYYDPRGMAMNPSMRSNFHAKCLLVDSREALITSANFTSAGQRKNVEVGVRVKAPILVKRLRTYFLSLVERGHLLPISLTD